MLSLLMGPYKNLHSRVIIVSPSVHVDPIWQVWKDFVRDQYDWAEEETVFDSYDPDTLREIIDTHKRINQAGNRRHNGRSKCRLFSLCIVYGDMSDGNSFHNSHGLIAEIFLRHRHYVQAICPSQKWRSLSTAVGGQACWICMWPMRSVDERKAAISEFVGMYSQKQIETFHEEATKGRFNFMYVNLLAPTREDALSRTLTTGCCHDFV